MRIKEHLKGNLIVFREAQRNDIFQTQNRIEFLEHVFTLSIRP